MEHVSTDGSEELEQCSTDYSNDNSQSVVIRQEDSDQVVRQDVDKRKARNAESARKCRLRKKQKLDKQREDLETARQCAIERGAEANRLRQENMELAERGAEANRLRQENMELAEQVKGLNEVVRRTYDTLMDSNFSEEERRLILCTLLPFYNLTHETTTPATFQYYDTKEQQLQQDWSLIEASLFDFEPFDTIEQKI